MQQEIKQAIEAAARAIESDAQKVIDAHPGSEFYEVWGLAFSGCADGLREMIGNVEHYEQAIAAGPMPPLVSPTKDYLYIRATGRYWASQSYYVDNVLQRARATRAPQHATNEKVMAGGEGTGTWYTTDGILNTSHRDVLDRIILEQIAPDAKPKQ